MDLVKRLAVGVTLLPWPVYCEMCAYKLGLDSRKAWWFGVPPGVCYDCKKVLEREMGWIRTDVHSSAIALKRNEATIRYFEIIERGGRRGS